MNDESLAPGSCVHRIGGGDVENLRLKSKEMGLSPPGISVLLGIADPTRHFPNHARIVHRDGVRGFRDANLRGLSRAFTNTTRS